MKPLPSIVDRVSQTLLFWAVLWGIALVTAVWFSVHQEVDELLDDTLQAAAEDVFVPLLNGGTDCAAPASVPAPLSMPATPASGRFAWQCVAHESGPVHGMEAPDARLLRSSSGAPIEPLRRTASAGFTDAPGWRVYGVPMGVPGHWLYVAQTRAERQETRIEVAFAVTLASLPMGLLALLWLRGCVRRELMPLKALTQRLALHDPLAAANALGLAQRQELQPVHDAIDSLGERLVRRMAQERAFSAHAAHALRTPLAGIDAQLAVAVREAPPELQARLRRVRVAAERLQNVVAALLMLFRSGSELHRQPLQLAELLARMPIEGLSVRVEASHLLQADADLVTAALVNLLDNAVRHGAREVVITTPAPQRLRITDDGPGVTAQRLLALQNDLDTQSSEGSVGLGLVLADLVARAHGGRLLLVQTPRGLGVELQLAPA